MAFRNLSWVHALVESFQQLRNRRSRRRYRSGCELLEPRELLAAVIEPVVDFNTGPAGIIVSSYTAQLSDSVVVFTTSTVEHGSELWRTDGTSEGTFRLTDLSPGPLSSSPQTLTVVGNVVYFGIFNSSKSVTELWRTDGTVSGTGPVRDSAGNGIPGYSSSLQAISDTELVFSRGAELWVTDGTTAGARRLMDLQSQNYTTGGSLTYTKQNGDRITFIAASINGVSGSQLLRYDWATNSVQTISSHDSLHLQAIHSDRLLFTASDSQHGEELWYSDGTPETTAIWSDLNPGPASSSPYGFYLDGPSIYFSADSAATGRELWKLPNHASQPQLIDVVAGPESSRPSQVVSADGGLFFIAKDGVYRLSDLDEPVLIDAVSNLNSGSDYRRLIQPVSAGFYFIDDINSSPRNELRFFSPSNNGVSVVRSGFDSIWTFIGTSNDKPVFLADDGYGAELWTSDGSASGTQMIRDVQSGTAESFPFDLKNVAGHLVFMANRDSLFRLAQAESGSVREIAGPFYNSVALETGSFNGELTGVYWHGYATESGSAPFRAVTAWDGSQFRLLLRLSNSQYMDSAFSPAKVSNTQIVVAIIDYSSASTSTALWTVGADGYLGESLGTFERLDQSVWEIVDGKLFFAVWNADYSHRSLWETDGTVSGTHATSNVPSFDRFRYPIFGSDFILAEGTEPRSVVFLNPVSGTSSTEENFFDDDTRFMFKIGQTSGRVLFIRSENELWATAGTAESTRKIGSVDATSEAISTTDAVWFFTYTPGDLQKSLWRSDGTTEGTYPVATLPADKNIVGGSLAKVGDRLVFATTDQRTGQSEVWLSDGTSAGTFVISSQLIFQSITEVVPYDEGIAFIAATSDVGREVFRINTTVAVTPPATISVKRQEAVRTVQWPDSRGAVQYDVWLTSLSDPSQPIIKRRVNSPEFELPDAIDTDAYRIWIRSVPVLGEPSAWSRSFDFTPGLTPVMYALPAETTDTTPTFSWAGSGDVVTYELWVTNRDTKTRAIYHSGLTATTLTPTDALVTGRYAVWVRATRANGSRRDWSALREFEILLPAISLTSGNVARSSRPVLTWDAVAGATHYQLSVQRSDGSIAYSASNIRSVSHTLPQDLPAGSYRVFVRAMNGAKALTIAGSGNSLSVLLPPTILTATNTSVTWTSVPDAVSYTVEVLNAAGQPYGSRRTVTQQSISFSPAPVPGQYSVRVFANFRAGSSGWTAPFSFEVFRPATRITSSNTPTADATPTITWAPVEGASGYEIQAARTAAGPAIYARAGITTASHRIETALPAGVNFIIVRAIFADGSRTFWSAPQQLLIGPVPTLTVSGRTFSWNATNQATHYELWINFFGPPNQQKFVYQPNYTDTSFQFATTMPRGRYQVWLRAIRGEGGELYAGLWTSITIDLM